MNAPGKKSSTLPQRTRQEKIFTMAGALIGLLLAAFDQTIVSTAGPSIQRELHIEPPGWRGSQRSTPRSRASTT